MSTPLISFGKLARVFCSEHIHELVSGGPTNEPMLKFVAQMLVYTRDVDELTDIFYACVGPDYQGNTHEEIPGMIERGIKKGFDKGALDGKPSKKKTSQAAVALAILRQMEPTLFHDDFNRTYISVSEPDKGPCIYTLKSQAAELFLKGLYYRATERPLHRGDFEELLDILSAKAMFDGFKLRVRHRISGDGDHIFINLCNKDRQAVRIDEAGFNVITDPPVILMNLEGMSALPVPLAAKGVEEKDPLFKLRDLLGLDEVNFLRVLAFIVGTLNPNGPYFFLLTEGEQGSGKSFLCRIIKDLIDPSAASKFVFPSKKHLSTVLSIVGEDFGIRVPPMPRRLGVGYQKKQRLLLRPDEVKAIFDYARQDRYGLYYVFLFMTGVRPSEMLGLFWEDVDFIENVIHIRRNQEKGGKIKNFPKTAAGQRAIPMAPMLREALMAWKSICPRREGYPERVFPCLGYKYSDPNHQSRAGGSFLLANFRNRVWKPMIEALNLPPVTPYVTRHLVISNLQAQGVEIGIVAKIAGHSNPQITLQHYTHQVRDSDGVMDKLNTAYGLT